MDYTVTTNNKELLRKILHTSKSNKSNRKDTFDLYEYSRFR